MALRFPPWPIRWVVVPLTEQVGKEGVGLGDGEREKGGLTHTQYGDDLEEAVVPPSGDVWGGEANLSLEQPWWLSLFSLVGGSAENTAGSLVDVSWAQP